RPLFCAEGAAVQAGSGLRRTIDRWEFPERGRTSQGCPAWGRCNRPPRGRRSSETGRCALRCRLEKDFWLPAVYEGDLQFSCCPPALPALSVRSDYKPKLFKRRGRTLAGGGSVCPDGFVRWVAFSLPDGLEAVERAHRPFVPQGRPIRSSGRAEVCGTLRSTG